MVSFSHTAVYFKSHPITAILFLLLVVLAVFASYTIWASKGLVLYNNGIFLQSQGTYARGQIVVTFDEQNYNDAINILTAFNRTFQLLPVQSSGNLYVFQVDVPVGQEQEWIDKFQGVQGVVSAHFAQLK